MSGIAEIVNNHLLNRAKAINNSRAANKINQIQQSPTYQQANKATEQGMRDYNEGVDNFGRKVAGKILDATLSPEQRKATLDRQINNVKQQMEVNKSQLPTGNDLTVVPLRQEGNSGIEQHYDRDVRADISPGYQGASLSGPTPSYSSAAPSAAPPAPRQPTYEELLRQSQEMLANVNAQKEAQLGAGPSVSAPPQGWLDQYMQEEEKPGWLDQYMKTQVSDMRAKMRISSGKEELNAFLNKVYQNIGKKNV